MDGTKASGIKADYNEDDYVYSEENLQAIYATMDAMRDVLDGKGDMSKVYELHSKAVFPLRMLKAAGKDIVLETRTSTLTAELANDTDWLK